VRWVALLFLSCLGVGWSIGKAIAGMMGQTGIPLDTKCTVVRAMVFLSGLETL